MRVDPKVFQDHPAEGTATGFIMWEASAGQGAWSNCVGKFNESFGSWKQGSSGRGAGPRESGLAPKKKKKVILIVDINA